MLMEISNIFNGEKVKTEEKMLYKLRSFKVKKRKLVLNYCESIRKTFNDEDRFASIILDFIYHS